MQWSTKGSDSFWLKRLFDNAEEEEDDDEEEEEGDAYCYDILEDENHHWHDDNDRHLQLVLFIL